MVWNLSYLCSPEMNVEVILESYSQDSRLKALADRIAMSAPGPLHIQGLAGAATAFLVGAMTGQTTHNHVIILNDKEEAAYFQNDLVNIIRALDIFYFPDSFKKTGTFEVVNSSHAMLRTEALMKFTPEDHQLVRRKILVTYPEALFEKVVPPGRFASSMVKITKGDQLETDRLLERLVQLGFHNTDFVYEPGQFAMRGDILDIYSFGNDKPYRLELFGDEVESIRIFDPASQLSERKLQTVTLIPDMNDEGEGPASVFSGEKTSFFEFLPENVIWWIKDPHYLSDVLQQMEGKLTAFLQKGDAAKTRLQEASVTGEEGREIVLSRSDFMGRNAVEAFLKDRFFIVFGLPAGKSLPAAESFVFDLAPQPVFNRKFDLLIEDLKEHADQQYALFIFAENPKQLSRIQAIIADLHADISFYQIPVPLSQGFIDREHKFLCYTDHEIFQRYHKYRVKQAYSKNKALTMKTLRELQPGDFVTHIDHGVGIYSGLQKIETDGAVQEAVRIRYKNNDLLYVNINSLYKISKYSGKEGVVPKVNKLGSDAWQKLKDKTKNKVKDIAKDLIKLYAARKAEKGFAHQPDTYLQHELEASFIYEDTPDQAKATVDVKQDMESETPMDRLVCGDVGFGKTEIAIRAAFKSLVDGKQAAVLVPTTILAYQHFQTFSERLKEFPCKIDYLNRFKTTKQRKETLQGVAKGEIDIVVGTHALLNKQVKFKDLGILIIDEEQKFGVTAKEKLRQLRLNVDTLTLTATPIPRTLQFSLMGARDLSIINTPPPNRQPIQTEVHVFNEDLIRDAIYFETERGGQVFFVHNRVKNLPEITGIIQGLCPDLVIATAHGKMEGEQLESTILRFINHEIDVLVCTNIVESGVDIPNANTIIVNNAHHFGLSDLHQLRGRVGRSNHKAFCYLLAPPMSTLTNESRKRLQTLEQYSDLGSGFQIAMRDLDIRGAGNLLGAEQSGFIAEIGFDMYHKILNEAIQELKHTDFKTLFKEEIQEKEAFVTDCMMDTDMELLIPDSYVASVTERLVLYQQLDNFSTDASLHAFRSDLQDRFGPVPPEVDGLIAAIKCRMMGIDLGFEKIIVKNEKVRCYFINNPDSPYFESRTFQGILQFIQTQTNRGQLKQVGRNFLLVFNNIKDIHELESLLRAMVSVVSPGKQAREKNPLLQQ